MEIKFNVTGAERKRLVNTISEAIGWKAVYKGMPTAAYAINDLIVDRSGTLITDERTTEETLQKVLDALSCAGFTYEDEQPIETMNEQEEETTGLTITVPLDKVKLGNLTNLLESKGSLIKKALGINALPIEVGEDTISFPWFSISPDADSAKAYTDFIAAICRMSREQKRINATEKEVTNEKYAFRCFLLRLGFIGEEYKTDRKILLSRLTGNAAWKDGAKDAE